jgi:hypothetical protein
MKGGSKEGRKEGGRKEGRKEGRKDDLDGQVKVMEGKRHADGVHLRWVKGRAGWREGKINKHICICTYTPHTQCI